ncbi:MAG: hypothetical protein LBO07_01290 [Coriobacteriales bacterium]|jgi:hypothetical protein|nr:hypothetical protein [Coriobacteriales bacterium]
MNDETRSYRDPLGEHMRALSEERERALARFPAAESLYDGFYAAFTPETRDGVTYLAGAEGIVGSDIRLVVERAADSVTEADAASAGDAADAAGAGGAAGTAGAADAASAASATLSTLNGDTIAHLDDATAERLNTLITAGWELRCVLSLVIYNAEEKGFAGECACLCYNPAVEPAYRDALQTFIDNIVLRIAAGDHPGLKLNQQQLIRVLESGGSWFLTKAEPLPEPARGWVVYRRRKSAAEHLVAAALKKNRGCLALSWLGLVLLGGLVVWLVWRLVQWLW